MAAVGAAAALLCPGFLLAPGDPAHAAVPGDGTTALTAAPSCWAVKQSIPASPDGVYWLQTPQLVTAQQFYCDMTTDGGGWVLIGRGREGWKFEYGGQGTAGSIRNTPAGTGAFTPAALPGDTVNGLLGGTPVKDLPDGVRIRRATDTTGTAWQELRWKFSKLTSWSWTFDGGNRLSSASFDSAVYNESLSTASIAKDSSSAPYQRVTTTESSSHGYKKGFAHGTRVGGGSNSATNHLWTNAAEGSPLAFSQVFIRPRSTTTDYGTVPDEGLPASLTAPLKANRTTPVTWGVTGVVGGGSGEQNIEVQGLAVLNNVLYVGGKFRYVQKGATPGTGEKVERPYLAAFDASTGDWLPAFAPVLNGQVWDIQAAGDKIVIGGEFTSVNGEAHTAGVAALDPVTGAVVPGWRASVTLSDGSAALVRAIDLEGGWLYLGGNFTRISGGDPVGSQVTLSRTARVRLTDGRPDGTWKPQFNGSVIELDATPDRVYYGGYFTQFAGAPARKLAVVTTSAPPAQVAGLGDQNWVPSTTNVDKQYRQTVRETGNTVWIGGSEHDFQVYTRDTFDRITGHISRAGGDMQAAVEIDGIIYGACHCWNFMYNDATNYSDPNADGGFTSVHQVYGIGAWNASTGEFLPNFTPSFDTRAGIGPWELVEDANGCLWFGGDFNRGSWDSGAGAYQWMGGFGRLCGKDGTAPAAPTNLRIGAQDATTVRLQWDGTPNDTSVKYELLKDGRVIATSLAGWSYTDALDGVPHRYVVRSMDAAGNRSASTPVLTAP
ncbi:fibrinogen-like YCDxxxxGGGW domain-containing protein [Actinocorallia sp. B10E7]|uniref:fibrinogen-like YCDxxxxGGGW domain-containing protein n=1 Tax=Actinocorallia sp. B10E7 TaxID=3153558 RepID=UPI00325CDE9A